MEGFFYPTQADNRREWFEDLLKEWQKGGKSRLCFPFANYIPHTLPLSGDFWMFMYYRQTATDIDALKGKVKYRIHVTQWGESEFKAPGIHECDFTNGGRAAWFLCDRAEEIRQADGTYLSIDDFSHRDGKQLFWAIRSSIAPVVYNEKNLLTVTVFP